MTHDNGDKISNKDRSPSPMHASSTEAQQESNETAVQNTKKKGVSYSVPQQIDEKAARQQQQQQDRSRFFAAEFATREPYNSSREQFLRDSMVTIEIQANIEKTVSRTSPPMKGPYSGWTIKAKFVFPGRISLAMSF